ncbi:MAG: PKD domain-containing protein [Bacteroidales bacterium]|nr:PKD domain-containing protein [Bacteroidales bacterium]
MKAISLIFVFSLVFIIGCEKENIPPTCEIISPSNGAEYDVGDLITISVEAEDEDGTIEEVRFYIDDVGVASASIFPFNFEWDTEGEHDGSKNIKVTVKDDRGATVEDEISILLNPGGEPPVAAFTADKTSITEGESVQFTDQSTNEPTSWEWDFGDGETSSEQNPSHIYSASGNYTVSLQVNNQYGSDTETKTNYITVAESGGGETGTLTDIDGNVYETVSIGTQVWMAKNLKVTHYPDGSAIPLVTENTAWGNLGDNNTDDAMCYYNNNSSSEYGALYTYAAALNACPAGWHLPSDAEWIELENFLADNGYNYDGTTGGGRDKIAKAMATASGWTSSTTTGAVGNSDYPDKRNASGFSGLPGGYRRYNNGAFYPAGNFGYWWSSTEYSSISAYYRFLTYSHASVYRFNYDKSGGFSIRCVRDD